MKKIDVTDMTLCLADSRTNFSLSFKEKLEIAKQLDKLNADTIQLPEIYNEKTDSLLIRTIAAFVQNSTLAIEAGKTEESVKTAWAAVAGAKHPRLTVSLPVSPIQMEYTCNKKAPKMLEMIAALVKASKDLCSDVEFCAVDATRSEEEFLREAISTAITAGATMITVCDNASIMMPDKMESYISDLYQAVPALNDVKLCVMCENEYDTANASLMMAVKAGADCVRVCAGGDARYPSAEALLKLIQNRGADLSVETSLKITEFRRTIQQIAWISNTKRSETSPFEATVSSKEQFDGLSFNEKDEPAVIAQAVAKLGYDLSEEDNGKVYEEFVRVARKKAVGMKELDAIVATTALQVPPTYQLISYHADCGNIVTPSAHITMDKQGVTMQGICLGDGPIDAAFLAIEQIAGRHYELDDFQIQSVTEGRGAMASALVRLRSNGKLYSGNGISTDIVGASIRAYVNALNKITFEEN
jgi:2-isopropylmalate synthase